MAVLAVQSLKGSRDRWTKSVAINWSTTISLFQRLLFHPLSLLLYRKKVPSYLSTMWTFGHISLWVYCRLLSGWVDMFSMPTKVTYQIVLLLRLLVWKHDNLHIGVKVVNTKYLQNTLFSLIYPVLGPRWSVPFDFS